MCAAHPRKSSWYKPNLFLALAVIAGIFSGLWPHQATTVAAETISDIFMNLLRLVSLPIIFLSIVATASSMESLSEIKLLGGKTVKYTVLTTVLAATLALFFYVVIDPVRTIPDNIVQMGTAATEGKGYLKHLMGVIPSNFLKPFVENNVIGVLILAILISFATISLPLENRQVLHKFFQSLFLAIMQLTKWIVMLMPIAIWGFVVLFIQELSSGLEMESLMLYLLVVVLANIVQATVILPILLKIKGINPFKLAKAMFPALSLAFFTKSSGATLPTAMQCATERAGITRKVASFSLPLCTSINMNGCAAFILTTVLFVSMSHGMTYTPIELVGWIFIATVAAVGNAGVPMGCYFLATAFLAAMDVPLYIMGIILPFYTFIDMLETSINVWSDASVTAIVDKELKTQEQSGCDTIHNTDVVAALH